ncbi:hypothetical protein D9M71_118700 [compost metagenome]
MPGQFFSRLGQGAFTDLFIGSNDEVQFCARLIVCEPVDPVAVEHFFIGGTEIQLPNKRLERFGWQLHLGFGAINLGPCLSIQTVEYAVGGAIVEEATRVKFLDDGYWGSRRLSGPGCM